MSHYKERLNKDCLNCQAIVQGRFCQECGQENIEPKESFRSLLLHFVNDITHFDGKFFNSIRLLLCRPGFLSLEYIRGRRAKYLHPIRMYVFISAMFFIFFFTLYNSKSLAIPEGQQDIKKQEQLNLAIRNLEKSTSRSNDSILKSTSSKVLLAMKSELQALNAKIQEQVEKDSLAAAISKARASVKDSTAKGGFRISTSLGGPESSMFELNTTGTDWGVGEFNYRSIMAYQRMQSALPEERRDGWIKRSLLTRLITVLEESETSHDFITMRSFIDNLLHSFPKILFISLPIFALLLRWMYWRRKDLLYPDHAILAIHLYCASFIFMFVIFGLRSLRLSTGWNKLWIVSALFLFFIYFYEYKTLRNFYQEGRGWTFLKFAALNLAMLVVMILLLGIFTAISVGMAGGANH